jgi:YVTN family beta-propeller protein
MHKYTNSVSWFTRPRPRTRYKQSATTGGAFLPTGRGITALTVVLLFLSLFFLNLGLAAAAPTVIATVQVGTAPFGVDVNSTTNRVYVANRDSNSVSVIDATTNTVIGSPITVGTAPHAVAVNSATNRIYVANTNSGTVTVIDGATNTVIGSPIAVGLAPYGIAVNPTTNRIYVANQTSGTVTVIDGATNATTGSPIAVGLSPYGIAVNPVTNRIYVTSTFSNNVRVIDGSTNTVIGSPIAVGSLPYGIAVNPATNRIYVANYTNNTVNVIDGATNAVIGSPLTVGTDPYGIAVNSNTNRIYVANRQSNNLTILDGATNTALSGSPVTVGTAPRGVALNPATGRVYVANETSNTLSVLEDGTVSFGAVNFAVTENAGPASITLTRTGSSGAVSATLVITNGTATSADYTLPAPASLVVGWANGETGSKTFQLPIVDDNVYEGNENLTLGLTGLTDNLSATAPVTATLIIVDNELPATTVALSSSPNPSVFGQSVTLTATVSVVAPGTGTPSGTVTFTVGSGASTVVLGTAALNGSGVAVLNTASLPVDTNEVRAQYGGSAGYSPSLSTPLNHVVNKAATSLSLTSSPNPVVEGNAVTFTATVSAVPPGGGTPDSGTVTFTDGATVLGTAQVNSSGVATFTTSSLAGVGSRTITATYGGNANYEGSAGSVTQQVDCNPLRVTSLTDGTGCGTFRGAIAAAGAATGTGADKTVVLAVASGSVISLTSGITLPVGVGLTTLPALSCGANGPEITIAAANGVSTGDGLTLTGNNNVYGIWVRGFSGRQIVTSGLGNILSCVRATKS